MGARARGGPGGDRVDAIQPDGGEGAVAALERQLTAGLGVQAARTLRRAEEAFAAVLGAPAAGRLEHLPSARRLLWVLARLDRYAAFGRGRAGAGLQVLEEQLEAQAWSVRYEGAAMPRHLGYFTPILALKAKRWKHTWAPKIKAARRSLPAGASPAGGERSAQAARSRS